MINYVFLFFLYELFKNRNKYFFCIVEYVWVVNNVIYEIILCNILLIVVMRNNNKYK